MFAGVFDHSLDNVVNKQEEEAELGVDRRKVAQKLTGRVPSCRPACHRTGI